MKYLNDLLIRRTELLQALGGTYHPAMLTYSPGNIDDGAKYELIKRARASLEVELCQIDNLISRLAMQSDASGSDAQLSPMEKCAPETIAQIRAAELQADRYELIWRALNQLAYLDADDQAWRKLMTQAFWAARQTLAVVGKIDVSRETGGGK